MALLIGATGYVGRYLSIYLKEQEKILLRVKPL